jgi:acetyl esterase/lipase
MSLRARLLNAWLRRVEKPRLARAKGPEDLRRSFELQARLFFHAPRGTQMQWQVLQAGQHRVEALEVVPARLTTDGVVLYIHGGAFVFGSPRTHAAMAAALAKRLGARVILPRYRLAPEAPFPAAPTDVRTAWEALLAQGVPAGRIVVGGDSAGGALAFGLLADLCGRGMPGPAGTFGLSPLTDLTYGGDSFRDNAEKEAVLVAERAVELREMYLGQDTGETPDASPLFASFKGAGSVWMTAGDTEILFDDARRMARRLADQGVEVTMKIRSDLPHVWPIFHNFLPEARETLDQVADWIRQRSGWPVES